MIQAKRGWICTVSIHLLRVRRSGTDTRHVESLVAVHDARGTVDNRYSGLPLVQMVIEHCPIEGTLELARAVLKETVEI